MVAAIHSGDREPDRVAHSIDQIYTVRQSLQCKIEDFRTIVVFGTGAEVQWNQAVFAELTTDGRSVETPGSVRTGSDRRAVGDTLNLDSHRSRR